MPRFSANLGFLWPDLPLPQAIHAAHKAGFDAVECHWPYDTPPSEVRDALRATGLPMLGLNTRRGSHGGLCAVPGHHTQALAAIDEALDYAQAIGAQAVHLMAGMAEGPEAEALYLDALAYAADRAPAGITLLIEALNPFDAPGYFLHDTGQAVALLSRLDRPNLRLMFDCYHVARTEGAVLARLHDVYPWIGHIQFAGVPHRGRPDEGALDYAPLFAQIDALGWDRPLGAEYRPDGPTQDTLAWMAAYRT